MENLKTWQKVAIVATALAGGVAFLSVATAETQTGLWTTVNVSGKLGEKVSLNVEEEFRFGDVQDPGLQRQHTDLSVAFKVADVLTGVSGYRNTSAGEHRPYVGLGLRVASLFEGSVDLDSYTRLEFRDFDTLRARSELSATWNIAPGVSTHLSNELFLDGSGLPGNRASVGVTKAINDTFGVNGYYLLDTALGDATSHTHVMGLGLSVSL